MPTPGLQAVVNEDTAGEAAALRREIKRLREELARAREGPAPAAGGGGGGEFGSPIRMPSLRTISGSPLTGGSGTPGGGAGGGQVRSHLAGERATLTLEREAEQQLEHGGFYLCLHFR